MLQPIDPGFLSDNVPRLLTYRQALWKALDAPDESFQTLAYHIMATEEAVPATDPIFTLVRAHRTHLTARAPAFHSPELVPLMQHSSPLLSSTTTAQVAFSLMRRHPTLKQVRLALSCYRHAFYQLAQQDAMQRFVNVQLEVADLLGQFRHRMSLFMASAALALATQAGLDRSRQVASQLLIMNRYRLQADATALDAFQPKYTDLGVLMHSYRALCRAMLGSPQARARQLDRLFAPVRDIQQTLLPRHRCDSAIWYSECCSRLGRHDQAARILFASMEQQAPGDSLSKWLLTEQARRVSLRATGMNWPGLATDELAQVARLPIHLPLCSTLAEVRTLAQTPPPALEQQQLHNALASLDRKSA